MDSQLTAHIEAARWDYVVKSKRGRIVRAGTVEFHSFLSNYYALIASLMSSAYGSGSSGQSITDTSGSALTYSPTARSDEQLATAAISGNANFGIQVGTGTTANSGSTYALATLIADGTSSGQLVYGANAITSPSGTSPLSFTLTRTFTNNSGNSISIKEIGLATSTNNNGTQDYVLMIRDVLGSPVPVANGANITWTLTLSYTIS